jgi:hypothetical protein
MLRTTTIDDEINVKVSALYYLVNSTLTVFNGGEVNLTAYLPTTENFARLVAIGLNTDTNLLEVVAGAEIFDSALTPPVPPDIPSNWIPSALIKLHYNALSVSEVDITDIRLFLNSGVTASGGSGAWPPDGKAMIDTTEYASITAALAAASSGDVVKVGGGTFAESLTIPSGVAVIGTSEFKTIINGTITFSGSGASVERCHLTSSGIIATASTNSNYLFNCYLITSASFTYKIVATGTAIIFVYNSIIEHNGSGSGFAIKTENTASIQAYFSRIEGTINGAGGPIYLASCSRLNGSVSGDVRGVLQDANDGLVLPSDGVIQMDERAGAPSNPATNSWSMYFKSDGLYHKDDAGAEVGPLGVGGGGWPFDDVLTVGGADADYQTLQDAIDACSGGEQIEVGIDVTEDVTVDVAVEIYGATKDITVTGHFILTAAAKVRNLTLAQTATGADNICLDYQTNNALVEDCVLRATGAGTNNYAAYMFGSYTGNELRNCDVLASGATNKYAVYLAGVAGTPNTFAITGGKFNGTTDDIYLNKSDMTLTLQQEPVLVNNDLNAANGTVNGNYANAVGSLFLAAGEDVYLGGDEAGIKARTVDMYVTPTDHFDGPSFSGYTWGGYPGFVTPSTIGMSTYPSKVQIWNNAAARWFAYKAISNTDIRARCFAGAFCYSGIRVDTGDNNNYVELFFYDTGATTLTNIGYRYAIGGVVTGPTALVSNIPPQYYILRIVVSGTDIHLSYGVDLPLPKFIATVALGVAPTRSGIVGENTAVTPNAGQSLLMDWIRQ